MDFNPSAVWFALILGGLPLLIWVLWWWNELWYVLPLSKGKGKGLKIPPGDMGFPFFGELVTFLWYFKVLRRPDEFINAKRRKYGDGVGMYRTHLFGSPSIITYTPAVNKWVLQSDRVFQQQWPTVDILGRSSIVAVHGKAHYRIKSFIVNSINRPDSLRRIALAVQPRMKAALQSWAHKGKINTHLETKKVTFENIGKLFVSFEPGPLLNEIDILFTGMVKGFRAFPLNVPGTAFRHAYQCRKNLEAIFTEELETRKRGNGIQTNDLMDGLMQMRDEGNSLSDQEILDNIVNLVIAGYQSTSSASMWAIYYLAKFPNVLSKLREENKAMSEQKAGAVLTSEDVSKLAYTNRVVEETVRMANVAAFVFRKVMEEVEYKGYKIPKDWKVIVWLRYLHTNPENFEDPMCFNPERWNKSPNPGTYQAFGCGARICAGNMLARIQLALLLHHLSVGYKWELVNPESDMIYLPYPLPVDGAEIRFSKL